MTDEPSPGVCRTCFRTVIGYMMYEFFDDIIKEDGPWCPYCGADDFREAPDKNADLIFDIPDLKLPSLYEVRRWWRNSS